MLGVGGSGERAAECQGEGQTKTDNEQIAREMLERQKGTHRNQLKLRETHNTQREGESSGMGKCPNKREGHTTSVLSRISCTDLGVQQKVRTSLSTTNRGKGENQRKPSNPWSCIKGHPASKCCCVKTAGLLPRWVIFTYRALCVRVQSSEYTHIFSYAPIKSFLAVTFHVSKIQSKGVNRHGGKSMARPSLLLSCLSWKKIAIQTPKPEPGIFPGSPSFLFSVLFFSFLCSFLLPFLIFSLFFSSSSIHPFLLLSPRALLQSNYKAWNTEFPGLISWVPPGFKKYFLTGTVAVAKDKCRRKLLTIWPAERQLDKGRDPQGGRHIGPISSSMRWGLRSSCK